MFKYTSRYCLLGMMSARFEVLGDWQGFKKNRNNAVSFDVNFVPDFKSVFFSYIYEKPKVKCYKMTQLISKFDSEFFELRGKEHCEIRETRNKFDKVVSIRAYNKEDTLGLIDLWDSQRKQLYGWFCHSGYDRNFFSKWYDAEKDQLFSRFYYLGERMIGYAVLHQTESGYEYLIRKADCSIRNLCLYVDYKTFEQVYSGTDFFVNWGASKGSLLRYKKKFPIFSETPTYFFKQIY